MDLLERIRRARAVALRRGDTAALSRLEVLEGRHTGRAETASPRIRHVRPRRPQTSASAWMFAEDDDWDDDWQPRGSLGPARRSSGPAPTIAELDAELMILEAGQRAHEARLAFLGRPPSSNRRAGRPRPIRVTAERREVVVRAARALIGSRRNGYTEVVDRDVCAGELTVKAAIGRLAGDPDAGREAFGTGFFREIPHASEQRIQATAKYLRANWADVETRADELKGKGFHPGTRTPLPAPLSFAGLDHESYWNGNLK